MHWLRWFRLRRWRARAGPVTRPLLAPDEPTCYTVTTSQLRPDGTTVIFVSCQAQMPWSSEVAWCQRVFTLQEWSGLSEDQRVAVHAAVEAKVAGVYRIAWRAHEWETQAHE